MAGIIFKRHSPPAPREEGKDLLSQCTHSLEASQDFLLFAVLRTRPSESAAVIWARYAEKYG